MPVVATLWLSSTAVILIGVNYVAQTSFNADELTLT